jgi:hypothetical protein
VSHPILHIAVVGHTNTGKTSLIRTLMHDRAFGEVRDRGGTTRQITSARLGNDQQTLIELYDSPGLENAPALIEWLDDSPGARHDGPERIRRLLDNADGRRRFDQEARVLELMETVDVGLYVIDAREPVLEKYQDELAILGDCARPLVAVLNFTATEESREAEWRDALARVKLHTVLAFDAVVRDPATEHRLFAKLASQLDTFAPTLEEWLSQLEREAGQRRSAALRAIADLLIDAAACRRDYPLADDQARKRSLAELRERVNSREQACVGVLLDLFQFGREEVTGEALPLTDGKWRSDPFDPETLAVYGIRTGKHIGAGVGAGAAIDLSTGGLSLGAGTVIGTLAGAGAGVARTWGGDLLDRVRGQGRLGVDEAALRLLAARQLELLKALIRRGHASQQPLRSAGTERWRDRRLPEPMRRARHRPGWSALNSGVSGQSGREAAVIRLAEQLGEDLEAA